MSGHEIASDIAEVNTVISAYRKPRYVLQRVAGGVSSDWQWYTHVGALRRRSLPREEFGRASGGRAVEPCARHDSNVRPRCGRRVTREQERLRLEPPCADHALALDSAARRELSA